MTARTEHAASTPPVAILARARAKWVGELRELPLAVAPDGAD